MKFSIKKTGSLSEDFNFGISIPKTDEEIEKLKNQIEKRHLLLLRHFLATQKELQPATKKKLMESLLEIKEPFRPTVWWNRFFKNGRLAFDLIVSFINSLKEEARATTIFVGDDVKKSSPSSLFYLSFMANSFSKLYQNFDVICFCLEKKKDEVLNTFYWLNKEIKKKRRGCKTGGFPKKVNNYI